MNALASALDVTPTLPITLSGAPALIVAAGIAVALVAVAVAVVIAAAKNRMTITVNLGRNSGPPQL